MTGWFSELFNEPDRLAQPWALVLLVLALLPLVGIFARRGALVYSAAHRLPGGGWRSRTAWLPAALRVAALCALVYALARPQDAVGRTESDLETIAIQLVIDRSGSMADTMTTPAGPVTRLEVVKDVVRGFIAGDEAEGLRGRPDDLIGMIAFAGFADTVCPLVRDHQVLLDTLARLDVVREQSEDGTAIGDALARGVARLEQAEREIAAGLEDRGEADGEVENPLASKVLILLTDGQENRGSIDPLAAASFAAERGIKVYTIGIGGDGFRQVGRMRLPTGPGVDEAMLRAVAERTGGRFFLADNADTLRRVYGEIDELERTRINIAEVVDYEELFVAPLRFGAVLLCVQLLLSGLVYRRLP